MTDEEFKQYIERLDELHKSNPCDAIANWDDNWNRGSVNGKSYRNDPIYSSKSTKRRHEFSPVLLVISTCYNCKHCGAKKEDTKTDYCDEKEDDLYYDTGGW
jgi:hypothetical protein